jgi:galactokinase
MPFPLSKNTHKGYTCSIMTGKALLEAVQSAKAEKVFTELYGPEEVAAARNRYKELVEGILDNGPNGFPARNFPETRGELRVFTAAGRTELGGNHTDHNQGKVLAASIQLDAVSIAAPRQDKKVLFRSPGFPDAAVDLSDLTARPEEKGTTGALIRGIAAELVRRGVPVRGFTANAASTVLPGSGLSSSAAVEVLLGCIFDSLFGDGKRSALELAQIGQKAENTYFGKPCGLMDQAACASGGAVAIDFKDPAHPMVKQISFDLAAAGYALCVVNTHGSHADLTPDYAAIPAEMKAVAAVFGREALRDVDPQAVFAKAAEIRKIAGDRAFLRAVHFFNENRRVDTMHALLEEISAASGEPKLRALFDFLSLVDQSGDSSWKLLQNVYSPQNPAEQGVSLALALTRNFLETETRAGACRVHGGGFAGTIQAYIPLDCLDAYRAKMEPVFGAGAVTVLRIRPIGAAEIVF